MTHYRLNGLFLWEILIRLLWLAIGAFVVLLVASWVFPQLNTPYVDAIFAIIITEPLDRGEFGDAYVTGIMGFLSALLTFILSAALVRQNQRKQSTLQILVESRSMQSTQALLVKAQKDESKLSRLERVTILNYYEFLAVGIIQRNLDEAILEKTIRGFLCRGTYIWRDIIYKTRETNNRHASYENLVAMYWRWMDKSREDERGKPGDPLPELGSKPWQWLTKTHKFLHSRQPIYYLAGFISVRIAYGIIY